MEDILGDDEIIEETNYGNAYSANNDVFKSLSGYAPKEIAEKSFTPRLLGGKYNAIIMRFERNSGEFPSGDKYDNYQLSVQVDRVVDAEIDGKGIYINKRWSLLDGKWSTGEESLKKMIDEIKTGTGLDIEEEILGKTGDEIFEILDTRLHALVGEEVTIRVWHKRLGHFDESGDWVTDLACEADKSGGALIDKKGYIVKVDKNGYIEHNFVLCKKVNLDSDVVTD